MGNREVRFVASTFAFGLVLTLALSMSGVVSTAKAYSASTSLTILSGDVMVSHRGGDFVAAMDGQVLSEGDSIRTAADARAVLTYFEGSTVTIEPSTELTIDNAATLADGGTVVTMTQAVGRTWHVVTKLIGGTSKYEVKTPASTASVRGTEFEVSSDATATTVSTTEGTVMALVQDPSTPDAVSEVPVTAGMTQTQSRHATPSAARAMPVPDRKVTVTVASTNTLVVDPLGRTNGVTRDGKHVVQTPGAQVTRVDGKIVITLPNLPDGRLTARVQKRSQGDDEDVAVEAKVEEKGVAVDLKDLAKSDGLDKTTGFEIKRANGKTAGRALDNDEKQVLPSGHVTSPGQTLSQGPMGTKRLVPVTPTQRPAVAPMDRPKAIKAPLPTRSR